MPPNPTETHIVVLVKQACAGDERAWQTLWREIQPQIEELLRKRRLFGRLAESDDDRRGVHAEIMSKLRADGMRRLKLFLHAHALDETLSFKAWLTVVAKRIGIDYLRAHPDYVDHRRESDSPAAGAWIEPEELPPDSQLSGGRPPVTARETARELLEYGRDELPVPQQRALEGWLAGHGSGEIAEALGLPAAEDAERLVRAALERLRRHFRQRPD